MSIDRDAIRDAVVAESARTGLNLSSIGIDRMTDAVIAAIPVEGEVEWEYAHEYTDEGGGKHRRKVSASEYAERKPDGHRADGSPYWNYVQKRRRKAGQWEDAPTA